MATSHPALDDCSDAAAVRLVPADPPLAADEASALTAALAKLFAQFAREGRVQRWAVETRCAGALLVIAWESVATLSGCRHDKIAQVLIAHEQRGGRGLLNAPPIVIEIDGAVRCVDRRGLKDLVAAGAFTSEGVVHDLRVETLGDWRRRGRTKAQETWLAPLVTGGGR